MPTRIEEGECVTISAGTAGAGETRLFLSSWTDGYLRAFRVGEGRAGAAAAAAGAPPRLPADPLAHVVRLPGLPIFFAAARDRSIGFDQRDLRAIAPTVTELLAAAAAAPERFHTIHCQLLAAGRLRTTPAVFHLIEMARGFGAWARAHGGRPVRLVVHVIAPDVLFNLDNSRVDLPAILLSEDIRFWVDVSEMGQTAEMRVFSYPPKTLVEFLVTDLDVPRRGWEMLVRPSPDGSHDPIPVGTAVRKGETLESIGIIPHSTLVFRRGSA